MKAQTSHIFLTAAGIVAIARLFHPALFSPHVLTLLLTLGIISLAFHCWKYQ